MPTLFLPCAGGVEALLAAEVQRITGTAAEAARGGVWVAGDERCAMQLNLHSRLAQRVLWPLVDGPYRDEHDLYALARRVRWADWITPQHTLRVDVTAQRSPLRSLNFAALRIKDAVCDQLREATGARPSVATRWPDLALALFVGPDHATLYVDTSGEALFKRGWREEASGGLKGEAPLKETLAAAMLAAAGWYGRAEDGPLLDPCCGAGTIAIEAAQMACGIAPGLARRFAFERLLPFRAHAPAWAALQQQARAAVHPPQAPVFAGDVSFRMTDFAARNAERAGVRHAIEFKTADALQRPPPAPRGTIVMNPPYGERIAPKGQGQGQPPVPAGGREGFEGGASAAAFHAALAAHWKRHYAGWTAWLLSPEMKLPSLMRLKESARVPLFNGGIECRLFRFDLVAGSHRPAGAGRADSGRAEDPGP
jgi:putative N6-adenine-specific DNA methylase